MTMTLEDGCNLKRRGRTLGPVLFDRESVRRRVAGLGAQISWDYRGKSLLLVAVLKGAEVFHADLGRVIDAEVETSYDFMAVGSYGRATRSSGEVRILKDLDESLEGRDILLVEDIVDSGLTLHYIRRHLLARAPRSLKVAALLDKPSSRAVEVDADYVGFAIPDRFVVGYGMDYAERYRNLPDIHILLSPDERR
ncbi:MAG: hypoxanthine phosphoribosyltransferase [Acidobacteriota bacterium]|jgi:hypoxanthine phosphoribosyltransferase|nr:hypoxanthine phosphoribosyltransferase [Acidobacteriota bacterium]